MIGRETCGRVGVVLGLALPLAFGGQAFASEDGDGSKLVKVTASNAAMVHELEEQFDVGYIGRRHRGRGVRHAGGGGAAARRGYKIGETLEDHGTWEARKAEIAATTEARRWRASSPRRASPSRASCTRASGSCRRRARP